MQNVLAASSVRDAKQGRHDVVAELEMCLRALIAALLCLSSFARAADNSAASKPDDLAKKVLAAGELQQYGKIAEKVVASLVKQAPAAELANGDGDISTTGACAADRDALCLNVPPGEGRLAKCIRTRIKNEEKGNVSGRRVTEKCKREVAEFYEDRGRNVNKNLQLASACKSDVEAVCTDLPSPAPPGAVLACLRKNMKTLKVKCKLQVVKAKIAAANDYKADATLATACKDDAERVCAEVPDGEGRVQACLVRHRAADVLLSSASSAAPASPRCANLRRHEWVHMQQWHVWCARCEPPCTLSALHLLVQRDKVSELSWDCHEELFRQQVEDADDIRMSVRLFKACRADQKLYCSKVEYGSNRVKDCLEAHLDEPKFTPECKAEFTKMMQQRASDFRLGPQLRDACADDISGVCGYSEASKSDNSEGYDARVLICLQDYRNDLRGDECKAAVHKMIARQASDFRMDDSLAIACYQDRKTHCASHTPGSARVIRCLQDHRESLAFQCGASLFDLEVRLAEDIDFQYPLKSHCAAEISSMCSKVKKGHARVIRCLHRHVDAPEMSSECQQEVHRSMNRMAQDYRLNFRLNKACGKDIENTCKNTCSTFLGQACGGTVLRCLQVRIEAMPLLQAVQTVVA
jgi:golgi apparatus protein 1